MLRICCVFTLCALLSSCSRGPENATDAKAKLPRFYEGRVTFDGERAGRLVRVPTDSLRVRDDHTLVFERVHFFVLTTVNNEILFDEIVPVRGTITVPGLDVTIENEEFNHRVAGVPAALRRDSFHGRLSADLQEVNADWLMADPNTGQERKAVLKLKAAR